MAYLSIQNIRKKFNKIEVLKGINLDINKGEFVCFLGPSGCGKTTLLRIIAGLEENDSGVILINEKNITHLQPSERNLSMVFQSYALFPNMTIYENIEYGLKKKIKDKKLRNKKIEEVLLLVNLEHISDKYPDEISGGQQQRVSLARAIALEPNILLLDEPLSALDAKVRENLRKEIKEIQKKLKITTIMVTHDQEEALTMADRIAVINGGEVIQFGTPKEIYDSPKDIFVADFIGKINFITSNEEVFAIRPEKIEFSLEGDKNSLKGKIKTIEFRGAFYRIGVEVLEEILYIDIISQKWERLTLKLKDTLYIKLNNGMKL
ncbi:ABC transporter ATP-binding protein [Fusobacterium sp. HC1336]|uniref:ABC transporter ATP-binding protein n=1 Tax=Fusobacterium sp. HC1336 TaxID=3171169 RepID=UPI003F299B50